MLRRIILILLFLLLLFLFIQTGAYYLFIILVLICSLCLVSYITMCLKQKSIKLEILNHNGLELAVHTFGWLPLGKINANVMIVNPFYNQCEKHSLDLVLGQKISTLPIPADMTRMGNFQIHVETTKREDMLNLFSSPYPCELSTSLLVVPEVDPQAIDFMKFQSLIDECMSDDYEIREYRDGDSLRDIHYKMTFKMNKILVKERLRNGGSSLRIFVDLSDESCEEVFRLFLSFTQYLIHTRTCSEVYWLSGEELMHQSIRTQDDLDDLIKTILSQPKANRTLDVDVDVILSSSGLMSKGGGNCG